MTINLKTISIANLTEGKKILDHLKIPFCLFLGSALGAYRDHDFCPGDDDDIDLYVERKFYAQKDEIISTFEAFGFEVYNCWEADDEIAPEISFIRGGCKLDLFFVDSTKDKAVWRFYENPEATKYKTKEIDSRFFKEFHAMVFFGIHTHVPGETEAYLEANYGKDWRIPISRENWDWLNDNQCKTQ